MARFERELAEGWNDDQILTPIIPAASIITGAHCFVASVKLHFRTGFCPLSLQLDAIREDLEAGLSGLRACRQLLVVFPTSLEEQAPAGRPERPATVASL
jgi:hypothetical protein